MSRHWHCPHIGRRCPAKLPHGMTASLGRSKGMEELGGLPSLLWSIKGDFRKRLTSGWDLEKEKFLTRPRSSC